MFLKLNKCQLSEKKYLLLAFKKILSPSTEVIVGDLK